MEDVGAKTVSALKGKGLGGVVSVVFEEQAEAAATSIVKALSQANFTVKNQNLAVQTCLSDITELAERLASVKLLVAVGGEKAVMAAKAAAKEIGAETVAVLTKLDGEGSFDGYAVFPLKNQRIRTKRPALIIVAEDVEIVEYAVYARLFYRTVRLLDGVFYSHVEGKNVGSAALFGQLADYLQGKPLTVDNALAVFYLVADSDLPRTDCVPNYLFVKEGGDYYENSFLAAAMILETYKIFLKDRYIDLLPPPDFTKSFKLLEKNAEWDYNITLSEGEFPTTEQFLARKFLLAEYGGDLKRLADKIDFALLAKRWRRSFKDAGYHLSTYSTGKRLVNGLSVASACDGGLLLFVKQSGFFEHNI